MHTKFSLLALATLTASSFVQAATNAECSGEIATPLYICQNLAGEPDIRLYVQEFQTCEHEKIVEFDRTENAYLFSDENSDAPEAIIEELVFSQERLTVPNRADNMTIIPPTSATIKTKAGTFKMRMTLQQEPDYEGAPESDFHYVGSFEQFSDDGKLVTSGPLGCFLN